MPLQATSGAASYDAFGGGVAVVPTYIEDVFSTYLYTGTGASQTITNGIDLSGKGGLVWTKNRSRTGIYHDLEDTARGVNTVLATDRTAGNNEQGVRTDLVTAFNSNGYSLGADAALWGVNKSLDNYVSWTFRKQPKFFDIVTYTGDGNQKAIAHNLGSAPGFIIAKATSTTGAWAVWHRSTTFKQGYLNTTADFTSAVSNFPTNAGTSTTFTVNGPPGGGILSDVGVTYVAYLFAHNAGGFGLTGTDNVISCGSWTGTGTSPGPTTTLGYEPQWIIWKRTDAGTESWHIRDNMRGMPVTASGKDLYADSSSAEGSTTNEGPIPTATGFQIIGTNTNANASGGTYIYIAIRRGPMKVPTDGTSVFKPVTYSGSGSNDRLVDTTITPDLFIDMRRDNIMNKYVLDRLRGNGRLYSDLSSAESSNTAQVPANTFNINQTGITVSADELNASGRTYVLEAFRRAPSFFDEVCYTGTGVARTVSHNLAAVPELMIVKSRDLAQGGAVYTASTGNANYLRLFSTSSDSGETATSFWNSTTPTASVFSLGTTNNVNGNTNTYVAYLFATCAGVSKVGSYTGTGTTKQIDCGFTAGARFVLIKRTDSTGDWYVWDSARGIIAGNDPYLLLNSTAAEVTSTDYIDTYSAGFEISSTAPAAINSSASGATYIFLAIA